MTHARLVLLAAWTLIAIVPFSGADAAQAPDFIITIDAGGDIDVEAPVGMVFVREETPGESYTFDLTLDDPYTVGEVRVLEGLDVPQTLARARQLVPRVDDRTQHPDAAHFHPHYFTEVPRDVHDTDGPAHLVNITGTADSFTTQLGFVGPGVSVFTLDRDQSAPAFTVGEPYELNHYSFVLETTTDEFAFATLYIRPVGAAEAVDLATSSAALEQTFPVQGLDANTTHEYWIRFTDWAGNSATSPIFTVRTAPMPVFDAPLVVAREPAPNSTVASVPRIGATFQSATPILPGGVAFFLDKIARPDAAQVVADASHPGNYTVTFTPDKELDPGLHTANFEVRNEAGGRARAVWEFTVAGGNTPAPTATLLFLGLAAVVFFERRR